MGPKSCDWCPDEKGERSETQRGEGQVTEAETGVTQPQAEERRPPPGAGRDVGTGSLGASRGNEPHRHFDLGLQASGSMRG